VGSENQSLVAMTCMFSNRERGPCSASAQNPPTHYIYMISYAYKNYFS